MLGFLIQRLLQASVVMLVISALVFTGVYAIGNPIDVMLSPDATQEIRERLRPLEITPDEISIRSHLFTRKDLDELIAYVATL